MNHIRFYLCSVFIFLSTSADATLLFSEYVEGSSYNKALEIYNLGDSVDFDSDGYTIEIYTNGSTTASYSLSLTGVVEQNSVFVVGNSRAGDSILSVANQLSGSLNFNGDDAVVLMHNGSIVDRIGQIGFDPGTEWGTGDVSTQDNTLRRRAEIQTGDLLAGVAFDPALQWLGYAQDSFTGLGQHSVRSEPGANLQPVSVPAPGSLILMMVGLLGLLVAKRPIPAI